EVASGRPYRASRARPVPYIHPTADGWVGIQATTGQQWLDFCLLIERPDWAEDRMLSRFETRTLREAELTAYVDGWLSQRPTSEIVEFGSLLRLPITPIYNGETILEFPQAH